MYSIKESPSRKLLDAILHLCGTSLCFSMFTSLSYIRQFPLKPNTSISQMGMHKFSDKGFNLIFILILLFPGTLRYELSGSSLDFWNCAAEEVRTPKSKGWMILRLFIPTYILEFSFCCRKVDLFLGSLIFRMSSSFIIFVAFGSIPFFSSLPFRLVFFFPFGSILVLHRLRMSPWHLTEHKQCQLAKMLKSIPPIVQSIMNELMDFNRAHRHNDKRK